MEMIDEETISGRFFNELNNLTTPESGIVFGCGVSVFPYVVKRNFERINLTAYDIDKRKIEQMQDKHKTGVKLGIYPPVTFTSVPPSTTFDILFGITVFHEHPARLINEAIGFLDIGGYIAVMDYDMKNMAFDDFFRRWGYTRHEITEKEKIGVVNSHKMHTSNGIEDCVSIMERNGIQTLVAKGQQTSNRYFSPKPPVHYIYVGRKQSLQKEV